MAKQPDDNDRHRAGTLPQDPAEGTVRAGTLGADDLDTVAPEVGRFLDEALDVFERRASGKAKPIGTPWRKINEALQGGLWPGMHVLTGSTGSGKSQWALQVALHAARAGTPVLYIGLELGHADLVARLIGLLRADRGTRAKPWSELYFGRDPDALTDARSMAEELRRISFRLEVAPPFGWSAECLFPRAKALRERHPEAEGPGSKPVLIVLDYLQVVAGSPGERQELRERIARSAYAARAVARDLNAAVLLLSSVSREGANTLLKEREDKENGLGTGDARRLEGLGKESGEIEFAADTVMTLCRGEKREGFSEMWLAVAKLRGGETSWQRLDFNGGWFWPGGPSNWTGTVSG